MKEYPITVGFNLAAPPIGKVVIFDDKTPIQFDHVFTLGGVIKKSHKDGERTVVDEFELLHVALIADSQFKPAKDLL